MSFGEAIIGEGEQLLLAIGKDAGRRIDQPGQSDTLDQFTGAVFNHRAALPEGAAAEQRIGPG
jgi:hypothetical protein